jgi:YggT family protein
MRILSKDGGMKMEKIREEVVTTSTTTSDTTAVPKPPSTVVTRPMATTERSEEVTVDPYAERRDVLYRLQQAVWLISGIVEGLIAIRFVLRLFGANPAAGFAQFVYGLTAPLIAPFVGLFPSPRFEGSVLEVTSIVALVVYALLAWVIVQLLSLLFSENRTGVVTRRTDTRIQ